jgi:glucosamine--fructose-6-phosphate aminotransferase (isomerizing)
MATSYLDDILEQPRALQATLESLRLASPITTIADNLASGKYRQVVLTGMGSSFAGLYPLQLRLSALPIGVVRFETAELLHYARELIDPANLIVAVSQSGESAEIIRLLDLVEDQGTVIGITNTPGSALARRSSQPILTSAGDETSVSCKTYISALAALTWLGDQLLSGPPHFTSLDGVPQKVADYLSGWRISVDVLMSKLAGIQQLFILGRGVSMAAACSGALIIKEAARFAAEGMNSAAFRHGPIEVISPRAFVMVYLGPAATSSLNVTLAQDIRSAGGSAEMVSMAPGPAPFSLPVCPDPALPILEILAAQMVSLALAELQGFEAGRFIHANKITITE